MARPMKQGFDYFPLDTHLDEKIQAIESVFKQKGFCWIVKFWQAAYRTNDGLVSLDGYHGIIHGENSGITPEEQKKLIEMCTEIGLLVKHSPGKYTSNGIQKRISFLMGERERWRKKEKIELSPEITPTITPAIRGESKEKEIKEKKIKENINPTGWRFSFENYEKEVKKQFDVLRTDTEWFAEREIYHPGLDINLSIEKAMNDFWGIEAGWKWKKKTRSQEFNLKATLTQALSFKQNQVWKKRPLK